jgi:hypothetical protein
MVMARGLTETMTSGDVVQFPKTIAKDIAESITITDLLLNGSVRDIALAETITVVDSVARQSIEARGLAETVSVTEEASRIKTFAPENTGGAGGVPLTRWDFDLNDAGVYHKTGKNVKGQRKVGGNK